MGVSLILALIIFLAGPQETIRGSARKQDLGGFEIGRIMVHDLLIPIPSIASHSREGRDPEIIRIEVPGSMDALHSFFATAMSEFRWKPMLPALGSRPCWTQVHPRNASTETLCITIPEEGGKAIITVKSIGDAK